MSKGITKFTPGGIAAKVVGDVAGDVIEGGLAGAGAAIGGAASGIGALAGGLASGAGSALGGALQGALTEPDVYITSYGAAGAYAKSTVKTTVNIQIPNGSQRLEATEDMSLEKLMSIAIKYLSSISKNLRAQSVAENKNNEQERLANRESLIEQTSSPTPVTSNGQPRTKNKMSGMTKALLGIGALGLGKAALSKIDMSGLDDLGRNIAEFQDKFSWVIDLFAIGSMAKLASWVLKIPGLTELIKSGGASLARAAGTAIAGMGATGAIGMAGAIGTTLAIILAVDEFVKDSAGTALAPLLKMEKKYGIKLNYDTSSGPIPIFKGATIDGKDYAPGKLPKEYQEIYDSYSGVRGSTPVKDIDKKYSNLKNTSAPAVESKPTAESKPTVSSQSKSTGSIKSRIYQAFINAGFSPQGALSLSAEVGRENSFNPDLIFGSHIDPHNGKGNAGIFSYQGSRKTELFKYLAAGGCLQNNQIERSQKSLDAMAKFARMEMDQRGDTANGVPLSQFLSQPNVNQEDAAKALGKGYIAWKFDDPKYASGHKNRKEAYAAVAKSVGEPGNYDFSTTGSETGGPMSEVKEMVVDGYRDLLKFISMAGKTDTQFRPITSKAGSWDKSAKLLNDQAKMEADMAMGRKETKLKTQKPSSSSSQLRKANGGSLDVINPNYKIDSGSILNTYIMSFSPDKKVWA